MQSRITLLQLGGLCAAVQSRCRSRRSRRRASARSPRRFRSTCGSALNTTPLTGSSGPSSPRRGTATTRTCPSPRSTLSARITRPICTGSCATTATGSRATTWPSPSRSGCASTTLRSSRCARCSGSAGGEPQVRVAAAAWAMPTSSSRTCRPNSQVSRWRP